MEQAVPDAHGQSTTDRVFAVVGGAMLLLAAVFLVRSFLPGGSDTGTPPAAPVPALAILSPAPGAEVEQPLEVVFDAGTELTLGPAGWEADGRHVHLFAGGTEVMAGATDVARLRGTRYRWTLPRLPAGETSLRLTWSGADHRSMPEGASAEVPVRLR
jgi:hypothetical protein